MPAPPREPPLAYPPAARERLLRIARAEWRDWGSIVASATDGSSESQLENFPRVLAYWRAVEDAPGVIARNRTRYAAALAGRDDAGLWREPPWSAAFISFLLRSAGVDAREFPPSAAHAFYIDALLADARDFPATAPFVPHDPASYRPVPGDLVCADRSRAPLADWRARLRETGRFRPMHCDLVLQTARGEVAVLGGNVTDAVALTRLPADAAGRLLPRGPGALPVFVVFENRLGRLPPWPAAVLEDPVS